jgi:hypothetical protein
MVSRRSLLPAILLLVLILPPMASAEMWRCALADGNDIYTNNPKEYQGCQTYEPVAELSVFYPTPSAATGPHLLREPVPEHEPARQIEKSPVSGEMPFEVWRMISVGMHETQVLQQAGPPTYISGAAGVFPGSGLFAPVSNALRYNYVSGAGDWIVVVEFDASARVRNVDRFRQRLEK